MPKKNTYQADDVFERPIRKRKHHVFKKIGFLFLTVILLFFVYGMADIMSNWITGKEQTSWFWFFKNNIKQEEKILYAVSLGSYATKSEAEEIARNSNVAGAGGYVYAKDQVFYVLGNIYATIEDAEKVIDGMSNAPYQTSILSITIPKVKQYDQSATIEDIAIIKETLDFMEEIYQTKLTDNTLNFDGIDMNIINVSCNLIKGYIDKTREAHKMMDFCIDKGITRLGFVGLMPSNQYCKDRFVSLDELNLTTIPRCYFTESKNRGKNCRCSNYLYNKDLKILEIYMRHYINAMYCESSLLYDGEYLRQGFNDNNIIY